MVLCWWHSPLGSVRDETVRSPQVAPAQLPLWPSSGRNTPFEASLVALRAGYVGIRYHLGSFLTSK